MKIVTVNIPESYIKVMDKLVNKFKLHPSRSELIRVAVREFLKKEIKIGEDLKKFREEKIELEKFDDKNYVRIPVEVEKKDGKLKTEFKTYKILREA